MKHSAQSRDREGADPSLNSGGRFPSLPVAALCCATLLSAQSPAPLTVEEAVALALRQNPAVAAARKSVDEAEARLKQTKADYYPQLGFNGIAKAGLSGATNALGLIGLPNSPFYRNFADSLNAYQRVCDFGRTSSAVSQQQRRKGILEADLDATEADVILQVRRAFYGLLRARRLRQAADEIVRSRELIVRQAQAFYEGQIRSKVDLDLARVSLSQAQLAALEAENAIRIATAEFGRALGGSQEAEYVLQQSTLPLPQPEPLSRLIEEALQNRPELRALQAERDAAAEAVRLARSQRRPFLGLAFSGGYARFTNVLARQLLAAGAGLTLPLFTGGRLEGQIEEAEAHQGAVESRLEIERQQVALQTRVAYLRLKNALDLIPALKAQSEYAREAARLAGARYRERLGSLVELNQSQAALAEAEAREITQAYAVKTADAELQFAVGHR